LLETSQRNAIDFVAQSARQRRAAAQSHLRHIWEMTNLPLAQLSEIRKTIQKCACICLHFHPDRIASGGKTVLRSLKESGLYQSQFETGISAGSVSAWPGGFRYQWEDHLFGGAYHQTGGQASERPKYGALDLIRSPDGPSPRFGSCYFVLRSKVTQRATFTYLDSHRQPLEKGTHRELDDILAALFTECFEREYALGQPDLSVRSLATILLNLKPEQECPRPGRPLRNLDHYIEAQVHGPVRLDTDVALLVADPSYRGSPLGDELQELALQNGFEIRWHGGFELPIERVPTDFRGPMMPKVAEVVARGTGRVHARQIGAACQGNWLTDEFGTPEERLQLLKRLWHVTLRFGDWALR
jgi:Protein of unknown function (DUF3626)